MASGLDIGFRLDERWHLLRGERMDSKQDDLLVLARVLNESGIGWALIGGLAYQVHAAEPRTTLDIDLAIPQREQLPREELRRAGFEMAGSSSFTENWKGPGGTPVQFSDEASYAEALRSAERLDQAGVVLRVINKLEFVRAKLRAAADPQRRRTKAMRDLIDLETILEEHPDLDAQLTVADRALLSVARARISRPG